MDGWCVRSIVGFNDQFRVAMHTVAASAASSLCVKENCNFIDVFAACQLVACKLLQPHFKRDKTGSGKRMRHLKTLRSALSTDSVCPERGGA